MPRLSPLRTVLRFMLSAALFLPIASAVPVPEPSATPPAEPSAAPLPGPSAAPPSQPWVARGDEVEAAYKAQVERLGRFYASLTARLKENAPDLLPQARKAAPAPVPHGYQILPKVLPPAAPPAHALPPRASVRAYSWPWTRTMLGREAQKLGALEADLARAGTAPAPERRALYAKLVADYTPMPKAQVLIEAHIQYNRLWQRVIATNRTVYDRQTQLEGAVVERQAIRDALAAPDEASFRKALASLPAGTHKLDPSKPRNETEIELRQREDALAREIHDATDQITPLPFIRVEHPSPHRWIIHVPFYTDIEDRKFLKAFKSAVQGAWHVVEGEDDYRVVLLFKPFSPRHLYRPTGTPPPKTGDAIDLAKHCALFPAGAAVLTTGAMTGHVMAVRCIVMGAYEIAPHNLAHEFGHILGFKDVYFRGYRDLGTDGFAVEEIIADPGDIMGAPGSGPVRRGQFTRLIDALGRSPGK